MTIDGSNTKIEQIDYNRIDSMILAKADMLITEHVYPLSKTLDNQFGILSSRVDWIQKEIAEHRICND